MLISLYFLGVPEHTLLPFGSHSTGFERSHPSYPRPLCAFRKKKLYLPNLPKKKLHLRNLKVDRYVCDARQLVYYYVLGDEMYYLYDIYLVDGHFKPESPVVYYLAFGDKVEFLCEIQMVDGHFKPEYPAIYSAILAKYRELSFNKLMPYQMPCR